jgi:hypothetical protein
MIVIKYSNREKSKLSHSTKSLMHSTTSESKGEKISLT